MKNIEILKAWDKSHLCDSLSTEAVDIVWHLHLAI